MRTYFISFVLCFSSFFVCSQKLELKKASPFTAVQWENEEPTVQFEKEWYSFEKLDHLTTKEILDFCKKQYGHKWQKRFSEDLVEVLHGLGHHPNTQVSLQLSKDGVSKTYTGTFTFANRQRSLDYNKNASVSPLSKTLSRKLSTTQALADLKEFEEIVTSRSSYAALSNFDYTTALHKLADSIASMDTQVDVNEFTNELAKIMSEIGDRHSSIKNEAFHKKEHGTYNLKLPFGVVTIDGSMVAVKQNKTDDNFTYYDDSHPFIKSIHGISIKTLVDVYNYRDVKAPMQAKLSSASYAIQNFGALLFKNNIVCPEKVKVVFSNGSSEKTETIQLTTAKKGYVSKFVYENYRVRDEIEQGKNFKGLSKTLGQNIGYMNIPRMYHYEEVEGLEQFIEQSLESFSETKALIIDVRNNPGGGRGILQTFAQYIVQPEQSPWIANVAYLRTESAIMGDAPSMSARYLYSFNSENFTDRDRKAIDQFTHTFELQKTFDSLKFSAPFYMVLRHGKLPYKQPVYILVNENSFSAATVFTSAFKGLPNVKIVGETTDGSSGNSRSLHLKHSNIRVKVSTMLSFQRNGQTLDGNGTIPDIVIPADEAQVLRGADTQLNALIAIIEGTK